jgi:hypothetical protein
MASNKPMNKLFFQNIGNGICWKEKQRQAKFSQFEILKKDLLQR